MSSYQGIDTAKFMQPQSKNIKRIMRAILRCEHPSICVSGGLGTSKTASILWCLHVLCVICDDLRVAVIRNEKSSMSTTVLPSFKDMLVDGFQVTHRQPFKQVYGGQIRTQSLWYQSGSELHFGGIDDIGKILGLNAGIIFWNQAERSAKEDYDDLTARLRGNAEFTNPFTGKKSTLMLSDANPGPPKHHLVQKSNSGTLKMMHTSLDDNVYFYRDGAWTESGENYRARLDEAYAVDDFRRRRFVDGEWAAASSVIFPQFNPEEHVKAMVRTDIPSTWKWICSVDFGIEHPAAVHLMAHSPNRKDICIFKSLHLTKHTSHALIPKIRQLMQQNVVSEKIPVVCDTASDSMQILQAGGLRTRKAKKDVHFGLDIMRQFFAGVDGRRIRINENLLAHPEDAELLRRGRATNLVDELLSLQHLPLEKQTRGNEKDDLWDKSLGQDDAVDSARYGIVDIAKSGGYIPKIIGTHSSRRDSGLFS